MDIDKNKIAFSESKYELMFIKFSWAFILGCTLYVIFSDYILRQSELVHPLIKGLYPGIKESFLGLAVICQLVKHYAFKYGYCKKNWICTADKFLALFFTSFAITYIGIGYWAFTINLFIVLMTTLKSGSRKGAVTVAFSFVIHTIMLLSTLVFKNVDNLSLLEHGITVVLFYLTMVVLTAICGTIYADTRRSEEQKANLLNELGNKCEQLEESNKKLTGKVAEFYTLQQISKAISSIFDIKHLLKYVNDIIIGVMGVAYSTIILYDERKNAFEVHTTNIKKANELNVINENINCSIVYDVLKSGRPFIENNSWPEKYPFTKGRGIKSMVCVPLNTKARNLGVVLVEHRYPEAFTEENMRLLDIIGQQVGIAVENAELYQKLQDMATIDGLTGVYNRKYFHERLKKEIEYAKAGGYRLSLVIYDIDNFKKFNDNFGHLFGDEVLKRIVWTIKNYLRNEDFFARFGGEEFVILLPRTGLEEAFEIAERLRLAVQKIHLGGAEMVASVTLSFGVSSFNECAHDENELIRTADSALYRAKAAGRNSVKKAKPLKMPKNQQDKHQK